MKTINVAGADYAAVLVTESDKLHEMAHTAVRELGKKLRNARAVKPIQGAG